MSPRRDIDFAALRRLRGRYGVAYPPGVVVFHEGEASTDMYVVVQGKIGLSAVDPQTRKYRTVRVVGPGEFFGEMACFMDQPRTATAVAIEQSVLLAISRSAALELMGSSPRFALGVIQTLCDRILTDGELIAQLYRMKGG